MTSAAERRREQFRANLRSRGTFWALFIGLPIAVIAGHQVGDVRVLAGAPAIVVLLVVLVAYQSAAKQAEQEFFADLAPTLGLQHTVHGDYVPITPLLAAGDRRRFEHTMEGPLNGKLGGPPCLLGHYTYDTRYAYEADNQYEDVEVWKPHRFTICAIDVGAPLMRFRGLYLQPRLDLLGIDNDWLNRPPKPQKVELESVRFNERYKVLHSDEQDVVAIRELFSPSLVAALAENPLQPGFECKGGTLVVYIRGHEESGGRLAMLLDTARSIARRLAEQESSHFSAAGQTIL